MYGDCFRHGEEDEADDRLKDLPCMVTVSVMVRKMKEMTD